MDKWDDSFAKTQLEKFGWKTGEGLGKEKHGNAKHITVKVKNDTKGVGKNQQQWDFAWWDHLYNKSASSVTVEKEENEIRVATKKKSDNRKSETGILSTYRPAAKAKESSPASSMSDMADQANLMDSVKTIHSSMAQTVARSSLYSGFVKSSSVLQPSNESTPKSTSPSSTSEDDSDDDGKDYSIKMTDAELFAACEGRTARKGGLGLVEQTGKYARVMQDYLAHHEKRNDGEVSVKRKREKDDGAVEKKKKKKSKDDDRSKAEKKKEKKEKKEKKKKSKDSDDSSNEKKKKKEKKEKKSKKDKN
ncbi:hypothetical protein BJV82DRAFT_617091 [Fennellomyces sp. T-0311]|nr:hypothetical protein BJV82DRAFT_617091 [Fennellomyces sp. T-0311]